MACGPSEVMAVGLTLCRRAALALTECAFPMCLLKYTDLRDSDGPAADISKPYIYISRCSRPPSPRASHPPPAPCAELAQRTQ
ncbi:hypothetical protein OAO87_02080 [bacterium]|nr:hypothetical protein [bacterium]